MTQEEFTAECNKKMLEPWPEIEGVPLLTWARNMLRPNSYRFEFSVLDSIPGVGICERVFSYHRTKRRGEAVQEVAVIPEDTAFIPVCRNIVRCYNGVLTVYGHHGEDWKPAYYSVAVASYSPELGETTDRQAVEHLQRYVTTTAQDVIALDSSLRYCAYTALAGYPVQYIRLYRKYPVAEMLMKLRLYNLCTESFLKRLHNKTFCKWLYKNADAIRAFSMSGAWVYSAYNKRMLPLQYLARRKAGKEFNQLDELIKQALLPYWTPEKVFEYRQKNQISTYVYGDYIRACLALRLNLADTKNAFPNNFRAMHDLYVSQVESAGNKLIDSNMLETAVRLSEYSGYRSGGFVIFAATSTAELVEEGACLHHCVGRMGYNKRQANGESIIFFLRRTENESEPFVTVELGLTPSVRVRQCYGDHDSVVPDEVDAFVKKWLLWARRKTRERTCRDKAT